MSKVIKIRDKQIKVLKDAKVLNDTTVEFPTMTDNTYDSIKFIMEYLGYHWVEKYKCFKLYNSDETAREFTSKLNNLIKIGEIVISDTDEFKRQTEFYSTPKDIVKLMIDKIELKDGINYKILEPSAGRGNILEEIVKHTDDYIALEKNRVNYQTLIDNGYKAMNISFEIYAKRLQNKIGNIEIFDRVVMNPPFSSDIKHLILGFKMLKPSGLIASIISENSFYRNDTNSIRLREYIKQYKKEVIELPSKTFASSGTNVETMLVILKKPNI